MELNVTIETGDLQAIDLMSQVGETHEYDHESEETITTPVTLGQSVARRVKDHLIKDAIGEYRDLRQRAIAIRDEEIRAAIVPIIAETLAGSIQMTNVYNEPTGRTTTLREIIMDQFAKLTTKGTDYGRGPSVLQKAVAEAVGATFKNELDAAMAAEKAKVIKAVQASAATLIADAVAKGLGR